MRALRFGLTCTAATCAAGAIVTAFTNCEDSSGGGSGASFDASAATYDAPSSPPPPPIADAGADVIVDAAPGCAPANMAGFVPPTYVHANMQSFDCPSHEGAFLTSTCFGDASTVAACSAFPDAGVPDGSTLSAQCNSCLRSDEVPDGGSYGPFVRLGGTTVANVAGCVELADYSDAGQSCAVSLQAAAVCVDRACRPSCPVTDNASRAAYVACTKLAAAGTCLTFAQAAVACTNQEVDAGGSAQQFCFSSSDPFTQFEKLAAFFCTS
jgi:hypothetical protein